MLDLNSFDLIVDRLDPTRIMKRLGMNPDGWQERLLLAKDPRIQLLCSRQSGKSTTTAIKALGVAHSEENSLILLLSPSLRQSTELFKKVSDFNKQLGEPIESTKDSATTLSLVNGSRVVSLPGSPDTIRGFSAPRMIIVDEAALTEDTILEAIMPMLATVPNAQLIALSSPFGARGWFWKEWENTRSRWTKIKVTARDCPRISPEYLDEQMEILGQWRFDQEFMCNFTASGSSVFDRASLDAAFENDLVPLFPDGLLS